MRPVVRNAPDWLTARPIAHRGLHDASKPENSLAALRAAASQGYAVEADIRLSRDGEIFVFHDDVLSRLTGAEGRFRDCDAAEINKLRLCGGAETIPTLAEFLATGAGDAALILELKSDFDGNLALARALPAALASRTGRIAVKSFDPALIAWLRGAGAPWPLGIVAQADYEDEDFAGLSAEAKFRLARFVHARETRPDFLSWRCGDLPNALCELACAENLPTMSWTVRSAAQAEEVLHHADQIVFEGFTPKIRG